MGEEYSTGGAAREPIFHVPRGVTAVLGAMVGVHLVRSILSEDVDTWVVLAMAMIPARFAGFAADLPGGELAAWSSLLTHMLAHADITHLVVNSATLLAFASAIERRIGTARFILFFAVCGVTGAVAFLVANPGLLAPMIGASGAISGMLGAVMRFFFPVMDSGGMGELPRAGAAVPLQRLRAALQDRRVIAVIATFILMNIAAQFGLGDPTRTGGVAWEAHIGGFLAGFLLFGWFDVAARYLPRDEPSAN